MRGTSTDGDVTLLSQDSGQERGYEAVRVAMIRRLSQLARSEAEVKAQRVYRRVLARVNKVMPLTVLVDSHSPRQTP